jgi:colanic acid/amylovoran biosynthesis protein
MDNKNPTKILLLGPRLVRNLGGPSLLPTTICVLNKYFPQAEYTFITPTKEDLILSSIYSLDILPVPKMWKILLPSLMLAIFKIRIGDPTIRQVVDAFSKTDIVIQIWGIWFADQIGGNKFFTRANQSVYFWAAKIFNKPFVKYTADLGPFNARWNRFFARISLQYFTDLILARNRKTEERVRQLGITTPMIVCPDTAFLLVPETTDFAEQLRVERKQRTIVGISVSHQGARQSGNKEKYVSDIAALADHICLVLHAKILLIPNEVSIDKDYDDVNYCDQVYERMEYKSSAAMVGVEYTGPKLKGIIGQCDAVVASRYHTIIASLSQEIPVLVMGWHEKYMGVLELFGLQKYLFPVDSYRQEELIDRFDEMWDSLDQIRSQIRAALPEVKEKIFMGGKAVSELIKV